MFASREEGIMTHSLASQVFCLGSLVDQQGSSVTVVHRRQSRTCVSEYFVLLGRHGTILGCPFMTLSHSMPRARGDTL